MRSTGRGCWNTKLPRKWRI